MSHQDGTEVKAFCSLIGSKASAIETKISDIRNKNHQSTLVDTGDLSLSGEKFDRWRDIVINAPSATKLKFDGSNYISFADDSIPRDLLLKKLAAAMAYDKHGLLDLIIYMDGHEEIRKPARKGVWTMPREKIAQILAAWIPAVEGYKFTIADVKRPELLRHKANNVARLLRKSFSSVDFTSAGSNREEEQLYHKQPFPFPDHRSDHSVARLDLETESHWNMRGFPEGLYSLRTSGGKQPKYLRIGIQLGLGKTCGKASKMRQKTNEKILFWSAVKHF